MLRVSWPTGPRDALPFPGSALQSGRLGSQIEFCHYVGDLEPFDFGQYGSEFPGTRVSYAPAGASRCLIVLAALFVYGPVPVALAYTQAGAYRDAVLRRPLSQQLATAWRGLVGTKRLIAQRRGHDRRCCRDFYLNEIQTNGFMTTVAFRSESFESRIKLSAILGPDCITKLVR